MKLLSPLIVLAGLLTSLSGTCQDTAQNHVNYYLDVATVYKEVMDYPHAIETLKKIPGNESDDNVKKLLGRLLYLNGSSEEALKVYNGIKDRDWVTEIYFGLIYEDIGERKTAISHYETSLRAHTSSLALFRLGKLYQRSENPSEAGRYFTRLVGFEPSIRVAAVYLGECLAKLGNYKDAYTYYAKGINYFPQNEDVKTQLVMVKRKLGSQLLEQIQNVVEDTRKKVKLAFYTREENIPLIRVGIATGLKEISFKSSGAFTIRDKKSAFNGKAETLYTISIKNKTLSLHDKKKSIKLAVFSDTVTLAGDGHPFYLYDISYGKGNFWHKIIDRTYRGDFLIVDNKNAITLINTVSVEEYLYGVLAAEIRPTAGTEALRAQAIAARSLAIASLGKRHKNVGFDVCADVHCQVYQGLSVETKQTVQAVKDTRGQILTYNNSAIEAFYHSNCGGCLKSDVFGGKIPFLETHYDIAPQETGNEDFTPVSAYKEETWFISTPASLCNNPGKSNYRWQRIYDAGDFLMSFGFPLKDLKKIAPIEKDDCFHYNTVKVTTTDGVKILHGDSDIRGYFDKLRSSACKFEIKYSRDKEPQMLIIWGAGFGHSGGLCQEGAEAMAKSGFTYREILKHYYPNAKIDALY